MIENFVSKELMMFYNVENFFPPDPKPVHKLDPTPSGLRNWDDRRYTNKLLKIGHVFQLVKEKEGVLPMMCGLSEVQGKKVLEDIVNLDIFENSYSFVHYESMDERGIDVALLYDKAKIEILHSEPITFFFEIDGSDKGYDTTRDVLWCKVGYEKQIINVFVLHLPSKREKDINKPKRDFIVKELKEKILEISKENQEAVIICGDFNENPDDENLKQLIHNENLNMALTNPYQALYQNKVFSTFHYANGLLFDQVILSSNYFSANHPLLFLSAEVFNNEKLRSWEKKFEGRPFRTYVGSRYLGGYSDHFPVYAVFEKKMLK